MSRAKRRASVKSRLAGVRVLLRALAQSEFLCQAVLAGKQGLERRDRPRIKECDGWVTDSLGLDNCCEDAEPDAKRWDYLLGVTGSAEAVLAVEVHPARASEVKHVIKKKVCAEAMLRQECGRNPVTSWHWVSTDGRIGFLPTSSEARRLNANGIAFPARFLRIYPQ